jgi:hypothetical protein
MSVQRITRVEDVKAAINLRVQEVRLLRQRRQELRGLLGLSAGDPDSQELETDDPTKQTVLTLFCTTNSPRPFVVPPEQIGNFVSQLSIAIEKLRHRTKSVFQVTREIDLLSKSYDRHGMRIAEQLNYMTELTGIPSCRLTRKVVERYRSTPVGVHISTSPTAEHEPPKRESLSAVSVADGKKEIESLKCAIASITKEIHASHAIKNKKDRLIRELQGALERKEDIEARVGEMECVMQCMERDIKVKQRELEKLMEQHERIDAEITSALHSRAVTCEAALDSDIAAIRKQIELTVEGQRRVQDRVIKAQEYRIHQLEKRCEAVECSIRNHSLSATVERLLQSLIDEKDEFNERQIVVPLATDDLYGIDQIIPPQETVHAAIYSLFVSDKERLAKVIAQKRQALHEKKVLQQSLSDKVEELTANYDEVVGLLEAAAAEASTEEELTRQSAICDASLLRKQYQALMKEKIALRKASYQPYRSPEKPRPSSERCPKRSSHDDPLRTVVN